MELLRAYLKQTKIFLIAFVFAVAASAAVVCLYQLPAEAVIYMAVLWLGAGAAAFLYGYVRYRQKTFHGSSKKATQESTAGRTTAPPGSDCI